MTIATKGIRASVIVPTRNRAKQLQACLASLTRQTALADSFEVIVIDNGSNDETSAVARAFDGPLQLRLVHESEPGLHVGRHAGARMARSDVLMFCDDDIEADPGWVEAVVRRFAEPDVALVGGNDRPAFSQAPPPWLALWWAQPMAHGRALAALSVLDFGSGAFDIDPAWVWGCNFSVHRAALNAARGFHPDGMPTDRLRWRGDGEMHVGRVVRAHGWRTVFDGAASVSHRVDENRMTQAYFEQRAFAQGISDSYAEIRRRGGLGPDLRRWLRPAITAWRDSRFVARARGVGVVQLQAVLRVVRRAYRDGVNFHRAEVRSDPALLAWVLKEDYL
jgi:glucosyl-dolichyl phosphate glucuronosyltransferase